MIAQITETLYLRRGCHSYPTSSLTDRGGSDDTVDPPFPNQREPDRNITSKGHERAEPLMHGFNPNFAAVRDQSSESHPATLTLPHAPTRATTLPTHPIIPVH